MQYKEDKVIDFCADETGVIRTRAGCRQVRELLDGSTLETSPPVEVQPAELSRLRPQDEGEKEDEEKEQELVVLYGQKLDIKPNVLTEKPRVDTWREMGLSGT